MSASLAADCLVLNHRRAKVDVTHLQQLLLLLLVFFLTSTLPHLLNITLSPSKEPLVRCYNLQAQQVLQSR